MNEQQFNEIVQWQDATFPTSNALSKIAHLEQEVEELKLDCEGQLKGINTGYRGEFADCFILLFGAAHKMGMSYENILIAIAQKMHVNKKRVWGKPDENGVVNHLPSVTSFDEGELNDDEIIEDEILLDDNCPNCRVAYDEVDYEYQICHRCKYQNKNSTHL